ncbi:MAG: DUF5018 domain-containing protein [Treponema sp.]|jgi:uncharacterized protein YcfJ|nr:DUF5018 domain-containing protein [Treponema sp.]
MRNKVWTKILMSAVLSVTISLGGCKNEIILSGEKAIISFVIGDAAGVISEETITITVPYGTNLADLSPVILFTGSTVNPASETAQDFTEPVIYQVSADDGSTRDYTVTVRQAASDEKFITSFVIGTAAGVIGEQAITVTVPYGTDLANLSPVVEFTGNAVNPASEATQDFTDPVSYQVSADDGSTRDYTVIVRYALSDAKAITSFTIGSAAGVISEETITITVPYGTNLADLSPVILFTGSTVAPASETAQNFTDPVSYQVSADDGSTRDYTVTVQQAASDEKFITSFVIGTAAGVINEQTISVTVPSGTDITSLSPVIGFTGNAVAPASETAQDFTDPVSYRVSAADGSTRDYTVIVRHAVSGEKAITSFTIGSAAGVISGQNITITVPYGTDVSDLSPVILFTGNAVAPASGTAQDFTDPVSYRVTAADGSTRDYVVTVQSAGRGPISISFTSLPYEQHIDLTADSENDLSRTEKDTLRITVAGTPVRWFIDSEEQSETGNAIEISALDYPVGIHHVTALVYKDEIPYSDELLFKIVK